MVIGSLFLTRHAVERADYLHVVLVALGFFLFISGGLIVLYACGFAPP